MTTVADDRTGTGTPPTGDRTATVAEAAERLGVTPDAIRARIRRGTLKAIKVDGEWVVTLPAEEHDAGQEVDRTQPDADRTNNALIDQLQSENAFLRDRLTDMIRQAATERERADVLQREALHRLEALTAGTPEAGGSPERAAPGASGESVEADTETPQASVWARLWRVLRDDS